MSILKFVAVTVMVTAEAARFTLIFPVCELILTLATPEIVAVILPLVIVTLGVPVILTDPLTAIVTPDAAMLTSTFPVCEDMFTSTVPETVAVTDPDVIMTEGVPVILTDPETVAVTLPLVIVTDGVPEILTDGVPVIETEPVTFIVTALPAMLTLIFPIV